MEILEPYELKFSDLKLLSSDYISSPSSSPGEELDRFNSMVRSLIENLGPNGPGLITIAGVPQASRLRRNLLPLARRLALLNSDDRKSILKEHGVGSDVPLKNPDRTVSSFAMQLKYSQGDSSNSNGTNHNEDIGGLGILGNTFKELGFCMMELGLSLARICDRALGGLDLEQSLLDSSTAKGRLIHYHSSLDNRILRENSKRNQSTKKRATQPSTGNKNQSNTWQQWHYDYGIFTILTPPMFILPKDENFCLSREQECPSPSGHTFLKIFNQSKNSIQMVKADPESFIVQVGEAADILSKGKLSANLHSVGRPEKMVELSRETFVVFLQPRWDKRFSISDYPIECIESRVTEDTSMGQEIRKIVPPLSSRLKDGMTFAEFSLETTKQYYGGRGLQSSR